jgi:hypothetical protein
MQIFREKIEIFVIFWANGLHIRKKNSIFVGFLGVIGSQIEQIKQIAKKHNNPKSKYTNNEKSSINVCCALDEHDDVGSELECTRKRSRCDVAGVLLGQLS